MKALKSTILLILFLLLLIAGVQNYSSLSEPIIFRLNLMFVKYETVPIPVGAYLILSFAVGVIVGMLIVGGIKVRGKVKKRKEKVAERTVSEEREEEGS